MKKVFAFMVCMLMTVASWAHDVEIDGIYYNLDKENKTAEVTYKDGNYDPYSDEVVIPESIVHNDIAYTVTRIGKRAFDGCFSLPSVVIPNTVTYIDSDAFSGCIKLKEVNIPNSVDTICARAFYHCYALVSVTLPGKLTRIDSQLFDECERLEFITIPSSVTSIGVDAFSGCHGLTSVNITDLVSWCMIKFENASANPLAYGKKLVLNGELVTDIVVTETVTHIGDFAFMNCYDLRSVTIPGSVTSIGDQAFEYCENLSSVTIPATVTSVGFDAFGNTPWFNAYCQDPANTFGNIVYLNDIALKAVNTDITTYTFRDNTRSITAGAFSFCSNLTSITIPNTVTEIGASAFKDCQSLTSVTLSESLTTISNRMFSNCSSLTTITIPEGVTRLEEHAFVGCSGLTSVTLPKSLEYIGRMAFWNCIGLTTLTIPGSVTTIDNAAFYGCTALASVSIPSSVEKIGRGAFVGCDNLETVFIDDLAAWCNIDCDIDDSPLIYATKLCLNGEPITDLVIPESVTRIPDAAFLHLSDITSVTISDSVDEIGAVAFALCDNLTTISIGRSVKAINAGAFGMEQNLKTVYCYAETVPATGPNVFSGTSISGATLIVPEALLDEYKTTAPWSGFGNFKTIEDCDNEDNPTCIATHTKEMLPATTKRIQNGKLIIEKNGSTYNFIGQEIK